MDRFEIYMEDRIDRACCRIRCLVIRKKEDPVKNKQLERIEHLENVLSSN